MRFRFTIRDLLWLMVVVALAVGWWTDVKLRRYRYGVEQDYENRIEGKYRDEISHLKSQNEHLQYQRELNRARIDRK